MGKQRKVPQQQGKPVEMSADILMVIGKNGPVGEVIATRDYFIARSKHLEAQIRFPTLKEAERYLRAVDIQLSAARKEHPPIRKVKYGRNWSKSGVEGWNG